MSQIKDLLAERGITLVSADPAKLSAPVPVLALSDRLAANYPTCLSFLKYIRSSFSNKTSRCAFPLSSIPEEERPATRALARELENCGLLADLYITPEEQILGSFPLLPRVNEFLSGDFLEIYAAGTVSRILRETAEEWGETYEILSNVQVSGAGESHELDLLFRLGEELFWCEVKSGHFSDYSKYYRIGRWLGVHPDRYILLTAEKTSSSCETISYFYEFHVSNIPDYPEKLAAMLSKARFSLPDENITQPFYPAAPAAERNAL